MKRGVVVLGYLVGVYLIVRAVAEPFVIDLDDPGTYRYDWGGPSLVGVLAVHCLPGVLAGVVMVRSVRRQRGTDCAGADP